MHLFAWSRVSASSGGQRANQRAPTVQGSSRSTQPGAQVRGAADLTVPQLEEKVCGEKGGGEPAQTDKMGPMALIKVPDADACDGCRGFCGEADCCGLPRRRFNNNTQVPSTTRAQVNIAAPTTPGLLPCKSLPCHALGCQLLSRVVDSSGRCSPVHASTRHRQLYYDDGRLHVRR